jgi:hypothetical protein
MQSRKQDTANPTVGEVSASTNRANSGRRDNEEIAERVQPG